MLQAAGEGRRGDDRRGGIVKMGFVVICKYLSTGFPLQICLAILSLYLKRGFMETAAGIWRAAISMSPHLFVCA